MSFLTKFIKFFCDSVLAISKSSFDVLFKDEINLTTQIEGLDRWREDGVDKVDHVMRICDVLKVSDMTFNGNYTLLSPLLTNPVIWLLSLGPSFDIVYYSWC